MAGGKKPPKPPPEPGITYTLVDLGSLFGFEDLPGDVNESSQVAGRSSDATGYGRAFLWHSGEMIDLGVLGGITHQDSWGSGINDLGLVVGMSSTDYPNSYDASSDHAFLITPEDTDDDGVPDLWFRDDDGDGANDLMIHLGVRYGDYYTNASWASAINNAGQIVGVTDAGYEIGSGKAFLINPTDVDGDGHVEWFWDGDDNGDEINDLMIDLGLPDGSDPFDINDLGQIVGTAEGRGFLWENGAITWLEPLPGGRDATAVAINSLGQVVGSSRDRRGRFHAVLWEVTGGTATITDLGGLKGEKHTSAADINDAGQVVGNAGDTAFLWENGTMTKLEDLISDSGGLDTDNLSAAAINESGEIAGYAATNARAFIAIPSSPSQ
jgi:probable HAF family extracellular repeat protein